MKYKFQLPHFPYSNFEIETSIWSGKSRLLKDNTEIKQSKEKGKPFIIPNEKGENIKAYPKSSLPDFVPELEINGKKNKVVEKLKWFQYALGGLPILLLFLGGALGGVLGLLASTINFTIFRQDNGSETLKYFKVIGIVLLVFTKLFHYCITNYCINKLKYSS